MRSLLLAAGLLLPLAARAAPSERGFRPVRAYTTEETRAGASCYAAAEDERGVLYVGNLSGVLEFDSVRWRLLELPNRSAARAVARDSTGRILVSGYDELGFLAPGERGQLQFRSLLDRVPGALRPLGDVIRIHPIAGGAVFDSERALLVFSGGAIRELVSFPAETPHASFLVGEDVFVWTPSGLSRTAPGGLAPFGAGVLADGPPVALLPLSGGRLLAVGRDGALQLLAEGSSIPFGPEASTMLASLEPVAACLLRDGRIAIGTRRGGVLILDQDGAPSELFDRLNGLPADEILSVTPSATGALWIGTGAGIAYVDASGPLSTFDSRSGLEGGVLGSARHHGRLHVGTSLGLFSLEPASAGETRVVARRVPGIPARVWVTLEDGPDLLVGTSSGLFRLSGGLAHRIGPPRIVYAMWRSAGDPGRVWLGLKSGLSSIRKSGDAWLDEGPFPGVPAQVRTIVEAPKGTLWLGTTFAGVQRVRVEDAGRRLGAVVPVKSPSEAYTFLFGGRVLVTSAHGLLRIDGEHTVPETAVDGLAPGLEAYLAAEDAQGNLWIATNPPGVALRGTTGRYRYEARLLEGLPRMDVQSMVPEPDGVVWFGSEKGLFRFDTRAAVDAAAPTRPLIRRVSAGAEGALYEGAGGEDERREPRIGAGRTRLRFECAAVSFVLGARPLYQYRLEGSGEEWSEWTAEPAREYTNLWEGRYRFQVRTSGLYGAVSEAASFAFVVLPPWHRTVPAWIAYALVLAGLVSAVVRIRHRALRRRARVLETLVAEKTVELGRAVEQLRVANEEVERKNDALETVNRELESLSYRDGLTGIANRRTFDDVLQKEWARAYRAEAPLSLLLLDIDLFKKLNDSRGHQEGDACLRRVAQRVSEGLRRSGDLPARYGGEELAVILPAADSEAARKIADSLRAAIEGLGIRHEESPFRVVTVSVGVSSARPREGGLPEGLVAAADRALYRAKGAGRNRVEVAPEGDP